MRASRTSITFAPVTINKDATENEVMHVNIGPTTQAGTYVVLIKAERNGVKDNFEFVLVFVDCIPPSILGVPGNQPASQSIKSGTTAKLNVVPRGNGPFTYQWYQGHSGSTAFPIAGATTAQVTTPAITQPTEFWVRVSNACGSRDSATALITPTP